MLKYFVSLHFYTSHFFVADHRNSISAPAAPLAWAQLHCKKIGANQIFVSYFFENLLFTFIQAENTRGN